MPNVFTADSVRDQLMAANKDYYGRNTWDMQASQIDLASQLATSELNKNYSDTVAQAYMASLKNKQAILGSNLMQGYKDLAVSENQKSLDGAFESYKSKYLSSLSDIESNKQGALNSMYDAVNSQATNLANYANSAFDYINWLYKQDSNLFDSNPLLQRYLTYDENGTASLSDLRNTMFTMDEDGNSVLSQEGLDFINFVQNYAATGEMPGGKTFTDYLYNENPELLAWLSSADPYNYGKSNADTFNEILGTSYQPYEVSPDKFSDEYKAKIDSDYEAKHNDLIAEYEKGHKSESDAENFMEKQRTATTELIGLANKLGLGDELSDLIRKVQSNLDEYDSIVADPGKGNNRKNREYATSNALADYEELYKAVMEKYGAHSFESTTERTKNYEQRKEDRNPENDPEWQAGHAEDEKRKAERMAKYYENKEALIKFFEDLGNQSNITWNNFVKNSGFFPKKR